MRNLGILFAGFLVGLMVGMGVAVGPVEATIAKKVPISGGDFSVDDEGYLEIDTHFTRGHVDYEGRTGLWKQKISAAKNRKYLAQGFVGIASRFG